MTMTVTEIQIRGGEFDYKGKAEYRRTFLVETDDPTIAAQQIKRASGLPSFGDVYICGTDIDPDATCVKLSVQPWDNSPDGSRIHWRVEAEYSTERDGKAEDDPLDEPPVIEIAASRFTRIFERAWKSTSSTDNYSAQVPIVNSCGDRPDHGVEGDDTRLVVNYQRNYRWFNLARAWLYRDAVNSDSFLLIGQEIPPGFAKLTSWSARQKFDKSQRDYWDVSVEISINDKGWQYELLDAGFHELIGGKKASIMLEGQRPSVEVPLNGAGVRLTDSQIQAEAFVYRKYKLYRELPFAPLGLT